MDDEEKILTETKSVENVHLRDVNFIMYLGPSGYTVGPFVSMYYRVNKFTNIPDGFIISYDGVEVINIGHREPENAIKIAKELSLKIKLVGKCSSTEECEKIETLFQKELGEFFDKYGPQKQARMKIDSLSIRRARVSKLKNNLKKVKEKKKKMYYSFIATNVATRKTRRVGISQEVLLEDIKHQVSECCGTCAHAITPDSICPMGWRSRVTESGILLSNAEARDKSTIYAK